VVGELVDLRENPRELVKSSVYRAEINTKLSILIYILIFILIYISNMSELALVNNIGRINALPRNASYYLIMGLPEGASRDQIRAKYRELSLKVHPDHAGNRGTGAFARLQGAYEALMRQPDVPLAGGVPAGVPGLPPAGGVPAFNAAANARDRAAAQAEYNRIRARPVQNPPGAPQNIQLPPGAEFIYLENHDTHQIVGPVNAPYGGGRKYWTKEEINEWLCEESRLRAEYIPDRPLRHMYKMVKPLLRDAPWEYKKFKVPEASSGCAIMGGKRTKKTRRFKGKSKRTRKVKRTKRSP